jgi:hypothetical protein
MAPIVNSQPTALFAGSRAGRDNFMPHKSQTHSFRPIIHRAKACPPRYCVGPFNGRANLREGKKRSIDHGGGASCTMIRAEESACFGPFCLFHHWYVVWSSFLRSNEALCFSNAAPPSHSIVAASAPGDEAPIGPPGLICRPRRVDPLWI